MTYDNLVLEKVMYLSCIPKLAGENINNEMQDFREFNLILKHQKSFQKYLITKKMRIIRKSA